MDAIEHALEILELSPDATPQDIKQAYRDLAKVWHPDRFQNENDSRVHRKAEEKLKDINAAYETLQGYDASSRARSRPHGRNSTKSKRAEDHERAESPKQDSSSPPFEPSNKKKSGSPVQESRPQAPRTAYIIGAILAICLVVYVIVRPNTKIRPRPSATLETRASISPPIRLPPDGENRAESNTREGASDRRVSGLPADGHTQRSVLSDVIPSPRAVSPEKPKPVAQVFFTVGSSKDEVLAVQGTPTRFNDQVWSYGLSSVFFSGDKVKSWNSYQSSPLKVQMLSSQPESATKTYFSVGSSKNEVLAVQGTPSGLNDEVWNYGLSSVRFSGDKVKSWNSYQSSPLKVKMLPSQPESTSKTYFTVGSSKDEVLAVQGTPSGFNDEVWNYGLSSVHFSGDKVKSWNNYQSSPLKVRLEAANGQ